MSVRLALALWKMKLKTAWKNAETSTSRELAALEQRAVQTNTAIVRDFTNAVNGVRNELNARVDETAKWVDAEKTRKDAAIAALESRIAELENRLKDRIA